MWHLKLGSIFGVNATQKVNLGWFSEISVPFHFSTKKKKEKNPIGLAAQMPICEFSSQSSACIWILHRFKF